MKATQFYGKYNGGKQCNGTVM